MRALIKPLVGELQIGEQFLREPLQLGVAQRRQGLGIKLREIVFAQLHRVVGPGGTSALGVE